MFKKTLIAAAVATVASTAAMAGDSSVSGQVKYTLADTDGAATDWAASFDNSITFKSTEDLGNGLTAFAQITIDTDVDTTDNTTGAIEKPRFSRKSIN
jgi:predicted porin